MGRNLPQIHKEHQAGTLVFSSGSACGRLLARGIALLKRNRKLKKTKSRILVFFASFVV
jgi:hypothetical protein